MDLKSDSKEFILANTNCKPLSDRYVCDCWRWIGPRASGCAVRNGESIAEHPDEPEPFGACEFRNQQRVQTNFRPGYPGRSADRVMNHHDVCRLLNALADDDEDSYHTLLEAPSDIVPLLIERFVVLTDGRQRARVVNVIWQYRLKSTLPFFVSALGDTHPDVWKEALDGIVTIGGDDAITYLRDWRPRSASDAVKQSWINEAIEQLMNG
jgi:hypothetical protein